EGRARIAELERAGEELIEARRKLDEAEKKSRDIEASIDPLKAKADAADLAIGRAGALQRQLDEALQKLSWIERDQQGKAREVDEAKLAEVTSAAEARVREAES